MEVSKINSKLLNRLKINGLNNRSEPYRIVWKAPSANYKVTSGIRGSAIGFFFFCFFFEFSIPGTDKATSYFRTRQLRMAFILIISGLSNLWVFHITTDA
jgi:hypothetical protein